MNWELFVRNKLNEADFQNTKIPVGHGLSQAPQAQRVPKDGDNAYTKWGEDIYPGVLHNVSVNQGKVTAKIEFAAIQHGFGNSVGVGGNEPITWDQQKNMWYAPMD